MATRAEYLAVCARRRSVTRAKKAEKAEQRRMWKAAERERIDRAMVDALISHTQRHGPITSADILSQWGRAHYRAALAYAATPIARLMDNDGVWSLWEPTRLSR